MDSDNANSKAKVKAWLLRLLADVEECEDVEAQLTESGGRKTTLIIQFKI